MKNDKDPFRRASEKKISPLNNNNLLWILLVVGAAMLLAVAIFSNTPEERIGYSELLDLIKLSDRKDGPTSIEVHRGTTEKPQLVQYSKPTDIKVGSYEATGKIMKKGPEDTAPREVQFQSNLKPMDNRLSQLLEEKHIEFDNSDGPSAWKSYVPMLVLTGLCVVFFLYLMRRLGGAGSPMAFGRSRGKMYAQEDLGVTFDDVAGIDEAVEELREVVEFLRTPEKYQLLGGRIPKGLLLVGPPGTGKTLLAKAIAGEAGVPFFSLSGSDFVEMFVGVGAARVRDMFQQAEAKAPCIIFIDELDALGKTRGSSIVGGHDEREQTLNALLVEMDGFDSNSGVIVLAASNRPETLDPALLRPGRFDRHVLVDRPDVRGREAILKVHVQNVKLDENVNLKEVAAITSGFVGADLANLVNEAALLAARKGKSAVGMTEFNEGVERVTTGLEKKQRVIHVDEKLRVAYHESGHALVAYSLPNTDPVHKVSIIPRGLAALGYTLQRPEGDRYLLTQGELESRIQVLLAGTCAEELVFEDVSTGAQNDLERASAIARSMIMDYGMSRLGRVNYRESSRSPFLSTGNELQREHSHSEQTAREIDQEVKRIIDESMEKVRHIVEARMASLKALSARLIEKEVIDSDELKAIIEANSPSPLIVPGTQAERKRTAPADAPERGEGEPQAEIVEDTSLASGSSAGARRGAQLPGVKGEIATMVKPIPDGYHTLTPYLTVRDAAGLIEYLAEAFGAKELARMNSPEGDVRHAEIQIGDSRVMLGEASDQWKPMPAMLYVYVEDTDAVYRRAIAAGGQSLREPTTEFYGDRSAGVQDPAGNLWWIATHVEDVSPEELTRRAEANARK